MRRSRRRILASRGGVLAMIAVALAAVLFLIWQVRYRGIYQYSQAYYPIEDADEWRYTACSRLVAHGYPLFREVFSAQPPLLFLTLAGGMRVAGDSILGARWVEIGFGLLGLLSSAGLAYLLEGAIAAGATALLLAVTPAFLIYSHTVEGEGPMMALATLCLALLLLHRRNGRLLPAVLAGVALAAAVLTKLFALEALAPALWLLATRPAPVRRRMESGLAFLGALALPVLLDFLLVYPRQQWDQVVSLHDRAAQLAFPGSTPPLKLLGQFLALDVGLSAFALAGLIALALRRRFEDAIFLFLWLPGTVVMLLLFHPLFPHHLAILSTGLAVCAGVGIGVAVEDVDGARTLVAAPIVAALILYAVFALRIFREDRHTMLATTSPRVTALASYVQRHTAPADFVVLDDLAVADRAHRYVPPPLCDPSNVRLRAGYLTARDLIGSTQKYRAQLVLPSFGIYAQVPAYTAWLDTHYTRAAAPFGLAAWLRRR